MADYPDLHIPLYLRETIRISNNQHPGLDSELPADQASRLWQERWLGLPLEEPTRSMRPTKREREHR